MSDPRRVDPQILRQALLTRFETQEDTDESVHPSHALKLIPKAAAEVKALEKLRGGEPAIRSLYFMVSYYVFSSLEHAVRLHRDHEIGIEEHEVFPILRVWALACYLDAPIDYHDYDWEVMERMVSGFYDNHLSEGRLPHSMREAIETSWKAWEEEN